MSEKSKTPLIRLAKRVKSDMMSPRKVWAIRIGSILFAFLLGMIPILMAGENPFESYGIIISGALSKPGYIRQTVKRAVPLLGVLSLQDFFSFFFPGIFLPVGKKSIVLCKKGIGLRAPTIRTNKYDPIRHLIL